MALEYLDYDSPEGCIARGIHREVIACGSATTLVASDSGALVLQDTAAGSTVTLPTPVVGMQFEIITTVSVTSNSHIITVADTATEFLTGGIDSTSVNVAEGGDTFTANGTSHVTLTSNGTTTGGLKGSAYRLTAISTTVWAITGVMAGSGTLADPFTT